MTDDRPDSLFLSEDDAETSAAAQTPSADVVPPVGVVDVCPDDAASAFLSEDGLPPPAPVAEGVADEEPASEFLTESEVRRLAAYKRWAPAFVLAAVLSGVWVGGSAARYLLLPNDLIGSTIDPAVVQPPLVSAAVSADLVSAPASHVVSSEPSTPDVTARPSSDAVAAIAPPARTEPALARAEPSASRAEPLTSRAIRNQEAGEDDRAPGPVSLAADTAIRAESAAPRAEPVAALAVPTPQPVTTVPVPDTNPTVLADGRVDTRDLLPEPLESVPTVAAARLDPPLPTSAGIAPVRDLLARYRAAYESLDARSAKQIWPKVDERALARAFDGLDSQKVTFEACDVVVSGSRAVASCRGSASYVTRLGNRNIHTPTRQWNFELQRSDDQWVIDSVQAR